MSIQEIYQIHGVPGDPREPEILESFVQIAQHIEKPSGAARVERERWR